MRRLAGGIIGLALTFAAGPLPAEPLPGPQGGPQDGSGHQLWLIPSPVPGVLMRANVVRPPGPGPFPLVVINHGSDQNEINRVSYATPKHEATSGWFVARGWVVVMPQRPGHGETGGPYLEDQGRCDHVDYYRSGMGTGTSIQAAIDYMTAQPFVSRNGVVVVGQSAGAWGALALASQNPHMVKAVINFAGGRGGHRQGRPNNNCAPDRLAEAAGRFGRTARIPTLWLYAENDSYFPPSLAKRMAQAFGSAGGRVEFHLLPPFKDDGHLVMEAHEAVPIWEPIVAAFLAKLR